MSSVTTVVVPLLGVVVGAAGAVLAQYFTTRVTRQQAEAAAKAAARTERKKTILDFLEVTQSVEQAAEQRHMDGELPDDFPIRVHAMWFQLRCIKLVGSHALVDKATSYVQCLYTAIYKELPEGLNVWQFLAEYNEPFLDSARDELDIPKS